MIQAGDTIGPYTLLRTIGRGAFGAVVMGRQLGKEVFQRASQPKTYGKRDLLDSIPRRDIKAH